MFLFFLSWSSFFAFFRPCIYSTAQLKQKTEMRSDNNVAAAVGELGYGETVAMHCEKEMKLDE